MKVQFSFDARKYFEADADHLEAVRGDDMFYI